MSMPPAAHEPRDGGSDPSGSDAYIRVRVAEEPRSDGSVLVYLTDGTGLVVNRRNLLPAPAGPPPG